MGRCSPAVDRFPGEEWLRELLPMATSLKRCKGVWLEPLWFFCGMLAVVFMQQKTGTKENGRFMTWRTYLAFVVGVALTIRRSAAYRERFLQHRALVFALHEPVAEHGQHHSELGWSAPAGELSGDRIMANNFVEVVFHLEAARIHHLIQTGLRREDHGVEFD